MNVPSTLEIVVILAIGFAVVASGIQRKWKYIRHVEPSRFDNTWVHVSKPEIKVRVRRLALLIFVLSRFTLFCVVSLFFAIVVVFADLFIDLDTSKR